MNFKNLNAVQLNDHDFFIPCEPYEIKPDILQSLIYRKNYSLYEPQIQKAQEISQAHILKTIMDKNTVAHQKQQKIDAQILIAK